MRPTKKPTLRQQLGALLEDYSERVREVMIMADLWREDRIKSKKLVEALEFYANEDDVWAGCQPRDTFETYCHIVAETRGGDTARAALAAHNKKEETI